MALSNKDINMIKTLINNKLSDITKIKKEIEIAEKVLQKMIMKIFNIK